MALTRPLNHALDVGCGTGQSTTSLLTIASNVVGTDVSHDMLREALRAPQIRYVRAQAERLSFAASSFDLLTVGLAFHWFDRSRFLPEAHRVLRADGWFVLYTNAYHGEMRGIPEFREWMGRHYLPRYPSPARHVAPLTIDTAHGYGFRVAATANVHKRGVVLARRAYRLSLDPKQRTRR